MLQQAKTWMAGLVLRWRVQRQRRPARQAQLLEWAVQACSDHDLVTLKHCLESGLLVDSVSAQGSSQNPRPMTLLGLTAHWGFVEGMDFLLRSGAAPDGKAESMAYGRTPLRLLLNSFIDESALPMAHRLLDAGARLETRSFEQTGWVTLHESLAGCCQNKQEAWQPIVGRAAVLERARQLDATLPTEAPASLERHRF